MRVSVFGLGYVGCVSMACLSARRHEVIGVDVDESKVDAIAHGFPTVVEPGVDQLLADGCREGRVRGTLNSMEAVHKTDASIICVGTPSTRAGTLDLSALRTVAESIGQALRTKKGPHLVVMRSTVPPGTMEDLIAPILLRHSRRKDGEIGMVVVPEFLREGTAVADYYDPPLLIAGTWNGEPNGFQGEIASLLASEPECIHWVQCREAEMMKSLCNVFHAMKVTFANEVGALCEELEIDGRNVMRLLASDRKLNISPVYLRPGLPYGGSCLPKDLDGVISLAMSHCIDLPLLQSIRESNQAAKGRALETAEKLNGFHRIGMDRIAFKEGTDDFRESPLVEIAEHLIGKGFELKIFDPAVHAASLRGANRAHLEKHIPHLTERLVASPDELLQHSEALILTRDDNSLFELAAASPFPPLVIDLSGAGRTLGNYRLRKIEAAESAEAEIEYHNVVSMQQSNQGANVA